MVLFDDGRYRIARSSSQHLSTGVYQGGIIQSHGFAARGHPARVEELVNVAVLLAHSA
jgi:hypothetical protein